MAGSSPKSGVTVERTPSGPTGSEDEAHSNVTEISLTTALHTEPSSAAGPIPGRPQEQLHIEDATEPPEDDIEWPKGAQLWLNMIAIGLVCFLHGFDLTVVAVAVPSLTDQFKSVADIGWYSAIYGLIACSTVFFFGKLYTMFDLKLLYITSVAIFEAGSLLCTFAPSSKVFILGRALAGFGSAGQGAGAVLFVPRSFPNHKRPLVTGFLGFCQSFGLVSAPVVGGALTDAFTWRACFGINVPIGLVAMAISAIGMKDPFPDANIGLPIWEKLRRLDLLGTLLVIPSIISLLMALQWGGNQYGWSNWIIILLIVLFVVLTVTFGYIQHRQQEKAILPLRIVKNKTVLAGALFTCCLNGTLTVTEYYIAIYFQGVRGYSATSSGLLGLPMIAGLAIASLSAAFGTTWIGYYSPFMYATGIFSPIAAGVLTTIDLDDSKLKVAALLGFLGFAVGLGIQAPMTATMTILSPKEVSIGIAVNGFAAGIGSSLCIATSAALFHGRLKAEIGSHSPETNVSAIGSHGLGDLRNSIGADRLKDVLFGYNEAVAQTLYIPVGLTLLAIVGAVFTEIRSVKKKRE